MEQEQPSDHIDNVAQVDGTHYSKGGTYQHWDWVSEINLPYLEACATKYLTRWKEKNGIIDLKKAVSYMQKLYMLVNAGKRTFVTQYPDSKSFFKFCENNNISGPEQVICWIMLTWRTKSELVNAITIGESIAKTAKDAAQGQNAQGAARGSGSGYSKAIANSEPPHDPYHGHGRQPI